MKPSALAQLAAQIPSRPQRPGWGARRRAISIAAADRYPIENGIPIPSPRSQVGRLRKNEGMAEAVRRLKVGQSVKLPATQGCATALACRYIGSGQYVTRVIAGGTRVWRTR